MAIVDRHGHAEAGAPGQGDVTNADFESPLAMLLPNGPAWPREDATLRTLVRAIATELSRLKIRERKLDRETDPATTFECVTDWEESYGLPDCAQPETLEARRAAIAAKLLAQTGHDQSEAYWTDLFKKLGYAIWWLATGKAAMTCIDDCLDELTDEQWIFVWEVAIDHGLDDALLACIVEHNALIETFPILHYLWTPVVVPEPASLWGVASTSDGYTVAVGQAAKILRAGADYAKPDGSGWALGTPDPDDQEDLYAVAAIGTVLVACGGNPTNFYRSIDHGATWLSSNDDTEQMAAICQGFGLGVALAAGESGVVWRSVDYGATWALATAITGAPNVRGLTVCGDGLTVGVVLAVAENGHIYRTPNSGTSWTDVHTAPAVLCGVGAWEMVAVAVGEGGAIARSVDGGATWAAVTSPTTANLRAVVGTPVGRWTACGDGGVILQSVDNGVTWAVQTTPTTENLRAITRHIPSNRAVIVGASTSIIVE